MYLSLFQLFQQRTKRWVSNRAIDSKHASKDKQPTGSLMYSMLHNKSKYLCKHGGSQRCKYLSENYVDELPLKACKFDFRVMGSGVLLDRTCTGAAPRPCGTLSDTHHRIHTLTKTKASCAKVMKDYVPSECETTEYNSLGNSFKTSFEDSAGTLDWSDPVSHITGSFVGHSPGDMLCPPAETTCQKPTKSMQNISSRCILCMVTMNITSMTVQVLLLLRRSTHTRTDTDKHTHTQTHTHTHTHTHGHMQTHTHRHTHTHKDPVSNMPRIWRVIVWIDLVMAPTAWEKKG